MLVPINIPTIAPPRFVVYRLGYGPDPFQPIPWRIVRRRDVELPDQNDDHRLGGRFDDPAGRLGIAEARRFRTIYCSSDRKAAFEEALIPFRSISNESADRGYAALQSIIERNPVLQQAAGVVPSDWIAKRRLGSVILDPDLTFVDLAHEDALQYIRRYLDHIAAEYGIPRIDFGALLGPNRRFTQAIASHFYELLDPDTDQPLFDGISYYSSLNTKWRCWAVFDQRYVPQKGAVTSVLLDDPDLFHATRHLDLVIGAESTTDK